MGIKIFKKQNFTLISNQLKKFWKNAHKKNISKIVTEIRIRNQREILRFLTPFSDFCKKKFFEVILVLFSNFEDKRAKNG
jgi:hypothetical protein